MQCATHINLGWRILVTDEADTIGTTGVWDDSVPINIVMISVPVISVVIVVLLIACVTTAIGGIVYSKRKKTTKFTRSTPNEQSISELSPLPTDDLPLQTINER